MMALNRGACVTLLAVAGLLGVLACSKSESSAGMPAAAGSSTGGESGSADQPSGGAGANAQPSSGGAAGADELEAGGEAGKAGEAGGDGTDFVNPVQASEADLDLLGEDADGNGVRDDLDKYLATLSPDESGQIVLISLAREETRMMLLGADPQSTASSAHDQAIRSMAVHHCLVQILGDDASGLAVTQLQSGLLNNELRWKAWLAAEHHLRGTILEDTPCNSGLVQR